MTPGTDQGLGGTVSTAVLSSWRNDSRNRSGSQGNLGGMAWRSTTSCC